MAKTYADVQKQIDQLHAEAAALQAEETAGVIARIKEAIAVYGITADQLGLRVTGGRSVRGGKRSVSASSDAKYADGQGGVWGGRGPRPAWLRDAVSGGKSLDEFAVVHTGGLAATAAEHEFAVDPEPSARKAASKRAAVNLKASDKTARVGVPVKSLKADAKQTARQSGRRPAATPESVPNASIEAISDITSVRTPRKVRRLA